MKRQANAGFSLLELALVTAIAGLLISLFLHRILGLMVEVERVNLLQWEAQIKIALGLEISRLVLAGEFESIGDLQGINPMQLLPEVPQNYLGEREHPDPETLADGVWVFDITKRVLIYTPSNPDQFQAGLPGRSRAEYRVELNYQDNNQNGRFDFKFDQLVALNLVSLGDYRWLVESD